MANRKCEHQFYRYCIDTKWNAKGGLSLGLFIFTPKDEVENAQLIRVHEYGHTIQSLVLGPFMLFVGIISVAWGDLPYFRRMRWEKHVPSDINGNEASLIKEIKNGETIHVSYVFKLKDDSKVEVLIGEPTADQITIGRKEYFGE